MDNAYVPKTQRGLFANLAIWVVLLCLLFGGLGAVGWRVGWWFQAKAVNYQAHILRSSYANQQTLRDQITAKLGDVATITAEIDRTSDAGAKQHLAAQRYAIAGIVCQDAEQVTGDPLPNDQAAWAAQNCAYGSVANTSPIAPN